jgi:hypothetical protein
MYKPLSKHLHPLTLALCYPNCQKDVEKTQPVSVASYIIMYIIYIYMYIYIYIYVYIYIPYIR